MVEVVYKYINEFIRDEDLPTELFNLNIDDEEMIELINNINEIISSKKSKMLKYSLIYDLLFNSNIFINAMNEISPKDLMMLITSYLYVPNCFNVSQTMFDEMSKCVIEIKDYDRAIILISTYKYKDIDFQILENEFINIKDIWYLSEYISTVKNKFITERVVDKIIDTKDIVYMKTILEDNSMQNILDSSIKKKLNDIIME